MTDSAGHVRHSIQLLISDWLLVDGTMDNHIQSAIEDAEPDGLDGGPDSDGGEDEGGWDDEFDDARWPGGEPPRVAQLGNSIRQAGWGQITGWPHDVAGFQTWPAPGQTATMTLTDAQWNLVVVALHYWAGVDERLSDTEGAARSRAVATAITHRLAEQGWSPELR